jgi:hypothetical protein
VLHSPSHGATPLPAAPPPSSAPASAVFPDWSSTGIPNMGPIAAPCGVHRADRPVGQLVQPFRQVDRSPSGEPWGLFDPVLPGLVTPPVSFRDTAPGSPSAAHCPRFLSGIQDHVGGHASRSICPRICRKSVGVKWLSASCKMKYRAWRIRRPPVLNNRCCRLVRDQLWMASGRTSRCGRLPRLEAIPRAIDGPGWPGSDEDSGGVDPSEFRVPLQRGK